MKFENKVILVFIVLILIGSIANFAYYYGTLRPYSSVYFPTDFQQNILSIRFIVSAGFIVFFIGILLRNFGGKIVSIISILTILLFYVIWYFEKFKWFEVRGIKAGTIEYAKNLDETGWFRGANEWDFIVLISSVALMFWIIFRYKTNHSKSLR